jgi:ADP-ribose pyrophosphatase YjhB (NUDIX family)
MEGKPKMPVLAVIVAVIDQGKILLTKREDFEVWCLPGGGVEEGESLAEAGVRETKEETGVEVELTSLVGVYSRVGGMWNDVHAVLFRAKPISGALRLQPGETVEVAYFPFDDLPAEILFGHRKRIIDAITDVSGVAMKQELNLPDEHKPTRKELYELRDKSGLSRQKFYMEQIARAEIREVMEVGNI